MSIFSKDDLLVPRNNASLKSALREGFIQDYGVDVEAAATFFLSVHNRRKSRAGHALGHHLEEIWKSHGIRYTREAKTEVRKRPDFLFPGQAQYDDESYDPAMLTMLGAKRTCKDRWRQVLSEADRVANKHLLTMQPSISENQTDEMKAANLQLVIPRSLFISYRPTQQSWLMDLASFVELVKSRQLTT